MKTIETHINQESGLPFGGIGTGTVELRPDGEFHEWQINNPEIFSVGNKRNEFPETGENLTGSLSFFILVESEGKKQLRRLGLYTGNDLRTGRQEVNYRMVSFIKPVETVSFKAAFPVAEAVYSDSTLPVEVTMRACSPFVPYDEKTSGTPGFFIRFSVRNLTDKKVKVSLVSKLKNILPDGKKENTVIISGRSAVLTMRDKDNSASGSVSLSVEGRSVSCIPGEYSDYMNEYVSYGPYGVAEESYLFDLYRDGGLYCRQNTSLSEPEQISAESVDNMSGEEVSETISCLRRYPFAESIVRRNTVTVPGLLELDSEKRKLLKCILNNMSAISGRGYWGTAALCSSFSVSPLADESTDFVFSWYFPSLVSFGERNVGHMYENWFDDSESVCTFLRKHRNSILGKSEKFSSTLYDSSYPEIFADAVSRQMSNLIKCSWWCRDGNFGVWEGIGSCGFHTTDVSYHGTHGIATLFPKLQKKQMLLSAEFQNGDGRIPHCFNPDFSAVDNGFDRVDMNPQFILMVYRDYTLTGDVRYLRSVWKNIIKAIDSISRLDTNNDYLPDRDAGVNTYDAWHFNGTSTYISVLWIASLFAASKIAVALGENSKAKIWKKMAESGAKTVDSSLFNGKYYNLWIDGDISDHVCMTDQMDGEYFARITGIGGFLKKRHVDKALDSIYKYNYSDENGLVNARYPENSKPTVFTYLNCQALANWSGIEYMMAAFYIMNGDYDKGYSIVNNVHERHDRLGSQFNHQECGEHYYRPMSSWILMQALSGVRVEVCSKTLFIDSYTPESFREPWFSSQGYGIIERNGDTWSVSCLEGKLAADEVIIDGKKTGFKVSLSCNGSCETEIFRS